MIDFFYIFTKGGIVLLCFKATSEIITPSINDLIRNVILNEEFGNGKFNHKSLTLQLKLDNEFDLVFAVAYQKVLQLSYADKFLSDVHLGFRDKYKNKLQDKNTTCNLITIEFKLDFEKILVETELWAKSQMKMSKQMKTFAESRKSKTTVASMISCKAEKNANNSHKSSKQNTKLMKKARVWDVKGNSREVSSLEFSTDTFSDDIIKPDTNLVGQMLGTIKDLEENQGTSSDENTSDLKANTQSNEIGKIGSIFRSLLASNSLTHEAMRPTLDQVKDHLISKNVAAEIADQLCASIEARLQGQILNTFDSITNVVKTTLTDSLKHILAPSCTKNIIRDCMQVKQDGRPYIITFCGVNGVGKTTNLAKICFWLIENNISVLIAACDTFRAGAIEQLRTHTRHLNALHPSDKHNGKTMVQLYDKGYGKDAAQLASEAIRYAKETKLDVVLVDTAGRMQNNESLMRSLAKLIQLNKPDLIIFVGEALVGNEAVNQLIKFNQALEDYSNSSKPRKIDGILLTKFDTVDDKVGAAITMAYASGKPIVFVGTGQTYVDLKTFNIKTVINELMK